jgi:uncharacterized membrane protein
MRVIEVPKTGANLFFILADSSRSLGITDSDGLPSREEQLRQVIVHDKSWQDQLAASFDLRRYTFDQKLESSEFAVWSAEGNGSAISRSLNSIADRFANQPMAGIILLTDGNDTDPVDTDFAKLPPVYPVVVGSDRLADDLSISRVSVTQTSFEAAPVTVTADIRRYGFAGQPLTVQLVNDQGEVVETRQISGSDSEQAHSVRFQFHPEKPGVSAWKVKVAPGAGGDDPVADAAEEATLANNERNVAIDRARGPYRVLYVSGRPNWEFKFLRRALQEDDEVDLVGLIRIAREEPKFTFRARGSERTNPLFRGFGNDRDEEAEQYNEPVLVRVGTRDAEELRDGFPKTAEELFQYQGIVLDDVEAAFFTQEQLALIGEFVSRRGGGFLMLGGQESFVQGNYDRTPVGELLPIYLDNRIQFDADTGYQLTLTREGWLQPWVRTESTEQDEQQRLDTMPPFLTVNQVRTIKPGAEVLAQVESPDGQSWPALVVQRFGRGRSAALLIGDFWRWKLEGEEGDNLLKSWRQTVRWLVSDVPRRVDVRVDDADRSVASRTIRIEVVNERYLPLDNAKITAIVTRPDGEQTEIPVQPVDEEPGVCTLDYHDRQSGVYRVNVTATLPDGTEIGSDEAGWVSNRDAVEFLDLRPNRGYLERIAERTGGRVVELEDLDRLASELPSEKAPFMERKVLPWWHNSWLFGAAIGLLVAEWGLRRWRGLA